MVPVRVFQCFRDRLRLATLLGMLAILAGPAQVIPGLLSLGVALEHSHAVRIGFDGETFRLVLAHDGGTPAGGARHGLNPVHHHGFASRLVCILGEGSEDHPDHTAAFVTGSAWEEMRSQLAAVPPSGDLDSAIWLGAVTEDVASILSVVMTHRDHGPPTSAVLQQAVRSIIFLI